MNKKLIYQSVSAAVLVALWQLLALLIGKDFLLASPLSVAKRLIALLPEVDFLKTVAFSLLRIGIGFVAAFVLGVAAAIVASRFPVLEYFLWPYVTIIKAVPVASFIILFLLWTNYEVLTVIIAFLITFPVLYSNVLQGMKSADPNLLEVVQLFRVPRRRAFRYVYLPSIKPFLLSACSVAVGMGWKAGVAAEVIGVVKGSIGEKLYESKIYFQNADLLAWTVVIIAVSALSEKVFVWLLKGLFRRIEKR